MATYDFRIAAGWNVPLVSLTNWENLPTQSGYHWLPPTIVPNFDEGVEKITGDGGDFFSGYEFVPWNLQRFRAPLWNYLFTTQASGLYRSKQTIYTLTTPGKTTYTRYNTWMFLPKPAKSDIDFGTIPNYTVYMTRLRPSS